MRRLFERPALSLVIISYNMERELPRTLLSLSPAMQRGLDGAEYEVIVVDNGSARAPDQRTIAAIIPNLKVISQPRPTASPVPAIHTGLRRARGDLVGVFVDGARMASPGLLAAALAASRLHPRPVIGALGFHLGPAPQFESVPAGYDQAQEDALLASAGWEADGYRLFGIAALGASASGGWFVLPNESNSLFLRREHWRAEGGVFDRRFVTPGGGFANIDAWKRLAEDPRNQPIILLGEATFHQVHGGIAASAPPETWRRFADEYAAIRGEPFSSPRREPLFLGGFNDLSRPTLRLGMAG
ncbi:MAG TPA: glycosyltransferase [Caulobacteraceae bacterium]|nr:glycosyltransferase [Caulobacteraceae bacterium]